MAKKKMERAERVMVKGVLLEIPRDTLEWRKGTDYRQSVQALSNN